MKTRSEIVQIVASQLSDNAIDLFAEQVDRVGDAPFFAESRCIQKRPSSEDKVGAQRQGLDDIGAAADAAVKEDCHIAFFGGDFWENFQGWYCGIELPSAVV